MREDRVPDELVLLQFADHLAVVGRRPTLLLGDGWRERLHFLLNLIECRVCDPGQLRRWNVHTELLEVECVQFRGLAKIGPRFRQDFLAHEIVVGRDLGLEPRQRLFVTGDLILLEQLGNAVHERWRICKAAVDRQLGGPDECWVAHSRAYRLLGQYRERCGPRLCARVLPQTDERCFPAFRRNLVVEDRTESTEDRLRDVEIGDRVFLAQLDAGHRVVRALDHDLQVLLDPRIFLLRQNLRELGGGSSIGRYGATLEAG